MNKFKLVGDTQKGELKNGNFIDIKMGDVIIPIKQVTLLGRLKEWFTGDKWYYFEDMRDRRLFYIHSSIIDRYFEEV